MSIAVHDPNCPDCMGLGMVAIQCTRGVHLDELALEKIRSRDLANRVSFLEDQNKKLEQRRLSAAANLYTLLHTLKHKGKFGPVVAFLVRALRNLDVRDEDIPRGYYGGYDVPDE